MASTLGRRAPSQGEDMKLWQVGVCAYGALYFVLAGAMEVDNLSQGYPIVYIACSMLAETLMVCGVFLFGLEASPDYARIWRWLFPLLMIEQVASIVLDAMVPADALGAEWATNELFGLWLAMPAYYFNLRIARYRG
jgi:hypothetical protein